MQLPTRLVDDFFYPNPVNQQRVGDQRAMAGPRHDLAAHQHNSLPRCPFHEGGQMFRTFGGLHVIGEAAKGNISPSHIQGPWVRPAEASRAGNVRTADAGRLKCGRQGVAVELRVAARARHGAHVNEPGHRVDRTQSNTFDEAPGRMAHARYDGLGILRPRQSGWAPPSRVLARRDAMGSCLRAGPGGGPRRMGGDFLHALSRSTCSAQSPCAPLCGRSCRS